MYTLNIRGNGAHAGCTAFKSMHLGLKSYMQGAPLISYTAFAPLRVIIYISITCPYCEPHGSELLFIVLFVQVSLLSQFFIRWS